MRTLLRDVSHLARMLAKSPGFFIVSILTLALGIGANTAIFSVINAVLLRPLPYGEPDRLVRLFETEAAPGLYPFAAPDYLDWQADNRTLEGMTLFAWPSRSNVSGAGEPQSAMTVRVEADFFSVLGVQPLAGRAFAEGEDAEGRNRVAVLSYGFWQRQFGGDASSGLEDRSCSTPSTTPSLASCPRGSTIRATPRCGRLSTCRCRTSGRAARTATRPSDASSRASPSTRPRPISPSSPRASRSSIPIRTTRSARLSSRCTSCWPATRASRS